MWNGVVLLLFFFFFFFFMQCPSPHLGMPNKNSLNNNNHLPQEELEQQQQQQENRSWGPRELKVLLENRNAEVKERLRKENTLLNSVAPYTYLKEDILGSVKQNEELLKVMMMDYKNSQGSTNLGSSSFDSNPSAGGGGGDDLQPELHYFQNTKASDYKVEQQVPYFTSNPTHLETFMILRNDRKLEMLQLENEHLLPFLLSPHYLHLHSDVLISYKRNQAILVNILMPVRNYLTSGSVFESAIHSHLQAISLSIRLQIGKLRPGPNPDHKSPASNLPVTTSTQSKPRSRTSPQNRRVHTIIANEKMIETVQNQNELLLGLLQHPPPDLPFNVMERYQDLQLKVLNGQAAINAS